jgi:hypothetical protein
MVAKSRPVAASHARIASTAGAGSSRRPILPPLPPISVEGLAILHRQIARLEAKHLGTSAARGHKRQDDGAVSQADWRVWDNRQKALHAFSAQTPRYPGRDAWALNCVAGICRDDLHPD